MLSPYLNVYDSPYNASGNGSTDDTGAFQKALDDAGALGGGIVVAPRGNFRIQDTLTIPAHVTLQGVFTSPSAWSEYKGTTLLAYNSRGDENGAPFITLAGSNSTIKGLTIYYPEQNDPNNIVPYPWTIRGGRTPEAPFDNLTVQDVLLVNPYQAVDFGTYHCGRHLIRGLYGQPLRVGIQVDKCFDVGRIEDIHFWPFWKLEALSAFVSNNGFALVLKRSDWQIVHNFFAFGYHVGVHLNVGEGGKGSNGQFTNLNLDQTNVGLDIYAIQSPGIHISNANIVGGTDYGQTNLRAILAHNSNFEIGALNVQNASFWGKFNEIIRWEKGGPLQISSSVFRDWKRGEPAIRILNGRATIQGNFFADLIGKSVFVDSQADRVIVTGNNLTGNPIESHGPGHLRLIESNLE